MASESVALGLGFIYVWFGLLKLFPGLSSAEAIAGASIELMSFGHLQPEVSLPILGLAEAMIGAALLTDRFLRLAILSIYFHVAGTLVPLVLLTEMTWSRPPIAASLEGQYIFKNVVTVGAALVISMTAGSSNGSQSVCRKNTLSDGSI